MESEFKYECNICFNEDILEKNIVYLNCLHYTCNSCFDKLKAPSCPFCRAEITLNRYKCDDDIFELENDYTTENIYNDFIVSLPTIRRDRQQSKRNKINKKKELLNSMIVEDENNLECRVQIIHYFENKSNVFAVIYSRVCFIYYIKEIQ